MKKIINNISIMCNLLLLVVLSACADEAGLMVSGDQIVVTATMPDDESTPKSGTLKSVAVSSDDNTLNLITKWKSGDKIQVFVRQDNKVYKLSEESAIYNISSDGKTCSFNFSLPSSIDGSRVYDVIGVTGITAQVSGSEVYASSTMKRMILDSNGEATSPLWFATAKTNTATNFQAKFQHLGTYEILHVTNSSSGDLTFRHMGFDVSNPWFKYQDNTLLNNTYDPTAIFAEPGDTESPPILIKAGRTGKILSWYIPSGSLIEGAKLIALINGTTIKSSNTKSSDLPIQRGKAYHMYATWDGTQLKFDDNSHGSADHEYVDLGLPSGTLWATMNVGAENPEDYGDYFAWGETSPKSEYTWDNYTGKDITSDEIPASRDAATANWGSDWRMPSWGQICELVSGCEWTWTSKNGVNGQLGTSKYNSKTIFLPAAGYRLGKSLACTGSHGLYWSRTRYDSNPDSDSDSDHRYAYSLRFESGGVYNNDKGDNRENGRVVRAVRVSKN